MGNESSKIWGGGVITHYLARAFNDLGHETWRASAMEEGRLTLDHELDFLISEGVPASMIPKQIWRKSRRVVYWWLSELYYDEEQIAHAPFDGIATNAVASVERLRRRGVLASPIELAASAALCDAEPESKYSSFCAYLGSYPHKNQEQLDVMLGPATEFGLTIWGRGWEVSPFRNWHRGVLPLLDIGKLYRSVHVVLAMTEERQKRRGMINNRIFEALACGAVVVSDPHPAIAASELGRFMHFSDTEEKVRESLQAVASNPSYRAQAKEAMTVIREKHTYHHRALQFLDFFSEIADAKS